jgi:hypothetical protein
MVKAYCPSPTCPVTTSNADLKSCAACGRPLIYLNAPPPVTVAKKRSSEIESDFLFGFAKGSVDAKGAVRLLVRYLSAERRRLVVLMGDPATGRTTAARLFEAGFSEAFPGGVAVAPNASSVEDNPNLDKLLRDDYALLILDDYLGSEYEVFEVLLAWPYLQVLVVPEAVTGVFELGGGSEGVLRGEGRQMGYAEIMFQSLHFQQWRRSLRERGVSVSQAGLDFLYWRTKGDVEAAGAFVTVHPDFHYWKHFPVLRGLQPFVVSGLLGPDGRPLHAADSHPPLRRVVLAAADDLIERVAKDPQSVYELAPRLYEEFVAELLARQGFDVELTPASRDGGKDIYAAKSDSLGSFMWIVECKRWNRRSRVGIGIVQRLNGVVDAERATGGILATTTFFSRDALAYQAVVRNRLALKDYEGVQQWVRDVWQQTR